MGLLLRKSNLDVEVVRLEVLLSLILLINRIHMGRIITEWFERGDRWGGEIAVEKQQTSISQNSGSLLIHSSKLSSM